MNNAYSLATHRLHSCAEAIYSMYASKNFKPHGPETFYSTTSKDYTRAHTVKQTDKFLKVLDTLLKAQVLIVWRGSTEVSLANLYISRKCKKSSGPHFENDIFFWFVS